MARTHQTDDDPPIAAKGTRSAFDTTRAAEAAVGESRD